MSDAAPPRAVVRVLLADDHATVRYGLKLLIDAEPDMTVVAEAGDGDEAVRLALAARPDVVVMDISMPGMNGLAATRALKMAHPGISVITLTRHTEEAYLQELLRAGASGYVLKRSAPTELLHAIRGVAAGGQYLDSTLTSHLTAGFIARPGGGARKPGPALTEREAQVLRLIAAGMRNEDIATHLYISPSTTKRHIANIYAKLDAHHRTEALNRAAELNLL